MTTQHKQSDAAIFVRVFCGERGQLPRSVAHYILSRKFSDQDTARMRHLLAKAKEGKLTAAEEAEIDSYGKVGHLLGILQSKARVSLKGVPQKPAAK